MINTVKLFRFIRYGLVGAVGTLAQYVILVGAVAAHIATPVVASMAGAVVGALVNYILNAKYTFHNTGHAQALPKFAITAIVGALMNGVIMKILIHTLGLHYLFAQVLATGIVLGITYGVNSRWTFRHAANPSD
ncbi:GtrA family protein [Massilia sp. TN1-12]|uniref:GtrA family protein n=1 Tax=Massilia paldalensis TaxID=3377675 RepID=UPI00384BEB02